MNILVRSRNVEIDPELRTTITRRIGASLDRFGPYLRRVVVELYDVNGPRGGIDIQCRIGVVLQTGGDVFVLGMDSNALVAVDAAIERAQRRVALVVSQPPEAARRSAPAKKQKAVVKV